MKKYILFLLTGVLTLSCNDTKTNNDNQPTELQTHREKRKAQEVLGQDYLKKARAYLTNKEFGAAKAEIDSMRTHCRRALTARESGILLMDSINLLEAEDEIVKLNERMKVEKDSINILKARFDEVFTKAEFYRRKLEHDKNQTHNQLP